MLETVRQNFRPEFLNRVDEIIIFKPLSREQIKSIVDIQLERLRRRLAERHITLKLTLTRVSPLALASTECSSQAGKMISVPVLTATTT